MNAVNTEALIAWRLQSQQLLSPRVHTAGEVVARLGGMQAQDLAAATWGVGLRMERAVVATIESALAEGEIVRTWAFRGTLHLLAAADVDWVVALVAPTVISANRRRYAQLDLDEKTLKRSNDVIARALAGEPMLSRSRLVQALEEAGISAHGQRAPYMLQRAALDGLICLGPPQGRQATYTLLNKRLPVATAKAKAVDRDEALTHLMRRYIAGHGPATRRDFVWWSGLPAADSHRALDGARSFLVCLPSEGDDLWAEQEQASDRDEPNVHLLPAFDEYLLGYKDRTAMLDAQFVQRVNAGGGMFRPIIIVDGHIVGTWQATVGGERIQIAYAPFRPLSARERAAMDAAAERYGAFRSLPMTLKKEAA